MHSLDVEVSDSLFPCKGFHSCVIVKFLRPYPLFVREESLLLNVANFGHFRHRVRRSTIGQNDNVLLCPFQR